MAEAVFALAELRRLAPEALSGSAPVLLFVEEWYIDVPSAFLRDTPLCRVRLASEERSGRQVDVVLEKSGFCSAAHLSGKERGISLDEKLTLCDVEWCEDDHAQHFGGMCASCGCELSDRFIKDTLASVKHGHKSVTVSRQEAARIDREAASTLLEHRKLALILDLDHTLIHTTSTAMLRGSVDGAFDDVAKLFTQLNEQHANPTEENPSEHEVTQAREALEQLVGSRDDVFLTELPPDPLQYVVKLRPGVREMLQRISPRFEMYVYTMGTRDYAERVVSILDPGRQLITPQRIVGRDDGLNNESDISRAEMERLSRHELERVQRDQQRKSLRALFPFDDSMAIIIDDRDDVWLEHSHESLTNEAQQICQNLIQIPQYHFFRASGEVNALAGDDGKEVGPVSQPEVRVPIAEPALDSDLEVMERLLGSIHDRFYGSVSADDVNTVEAHPNTKDIIRYLRQRVFFGCGITFSHIIPRATKSWSVKQQDSTIWKNVERYGGTCFEQLSSRDPDSAASSSSPTNNRVTHLVAANAATQKVVDAKHSDGVYVVNRTWLDRSMKCWERVPEEDCPLAQGGVGDEASEPISVLRAGSSPPSIPTLTWSKFQALLEEEKLRQRAQREEAEQRKRAAELETARKAEQEVARPQEPDDLDSLFGSDSDSGELVVEQRGPVKRSAREAFGDEGLDEENSQQRARMEEEDDEMGELNAELSDILASDDDE